MRILTFKNEEINLLGFDYLKQYEDMFKQYQELLNKGMGNHKDMLTSIMREQLDDLKDTYKLPMDKIREIEDRILAPKLKEQAEKLGIIISD